MYIGAVISTLHPNARPTEDERISGPWHGVFVGAYVTGLDGRFYGYAKLFEALPEDLWSCPAVMKFAAGDHDRESDALEAAERKGLAAIEELLEPGFRSFWEFHVARAMRQRWRG